VIDFRYHLVSIVAVFLALAIGIVLGSTELQGPAYNFLNSTTAKLQNDLNSVTAQRDTAQAQANVDEAYAAAVEPVVLRDLLSGQRLLVITEPGAQASVVSGITSAAHDAGAVVTGQIALQPKFFDTSDTSQDALNQTTLTVAQQAGIALNNSETYQQQAAQVLATEILTKSSAPGQQAAGQQTGVGQAAAQTMLAAYAQSGFLTTSGQSAAQATLAVVVTPQTAPTDGGSDPLSQLLVPLAQELAASSSATVVAGSSAGSGPGSPIAVLRGSNVTSQVSTVDDADLISGQTVVVQALAIQLDGGKPGSYGTTGNGASAVAPSPAPAPSPSPSASPTSAPATKKKAGK
jgi:Copper transport outer membrane protein, MctB